MGQDTSERRRKPRQLARGIANLLDDLVSQQPVPNFWATVSRRVQKDDMPTASTRVASPIETGTATSPQQRERPKAARHGLAVPCGAPIIKAHQFSAIAHWAASQ